MSSVQKTHTDEPQAHASDTRIMDARTYEEKLRDPRWQRRRLEIFQRDKWACQLCSRTDMELHVHHLHRTTQNPWEEPDLHLLTVCRLCHEQQPSNPYGHISNPKRLYVTDAEWWEKHGQGYSVELQEMLDRTVASDSTVKGLSKKIWRIEETIHVLRLDWEKNGYPAVICKPYLYRDNPSQEPIELEQDELATAFDDGGPKAVAQVLERRQMRLMQLGSRTMVAGVPVVRIPAPVQKYSDFLQWWYEVGRLRPCDPQGWSTISGPGVMRDRKEMITADDWNSLPESEQELIRTWAGNLPLGVLYD